MSKTWASENSWAEEYLILQALRDALQSKEAQDFLGKLAEVPREAEPLTDEPRPEEPVTLCFEEEGLPAQAELEVSGES